MKFLTIIFLLAISIGAYAQDTEATSLPYKQIPEYPANYKSGNIMSRFIDGLGYRYYWATEGLTEKDLSFKPSTDARSTQETIKHLYDLSNMILNAAQALPTIRSEEKNEQSFSQLRKQTLLNLQQASLLYQDKNAKAVSKTSIVFQNGESKREFPSWHLINGPISDAIYHTGQVVSFRRSSGNPMNPKVSVFMGKTQE